MTHDPIDEARRRRAADSALASVALDDLHVDQHTRDLLEAAVHGELSAEQIYRQVVHHARQDRP